MHTVIVEENGIFKVYTKGADSEVIKRLYKPEEQPYLEVTQMALDDFSRVGLRTLVFASKILTAEQFEAIQAEYSKAYESVDRKSKIKTLCEKVEKDLFLLGCTAIEDNLQDKVPESIKKFLEANIKVWMITGDKFETAENIAGCAGLTDSETFIYRFKSANQEEFPEKVKELKRMIQQQGAKTRKAIIMDTTKISRSF